MWKSVTWVRLASVAFLGLVILSAQVKADTSEEIVEAKQLLEEAELTIKKMKQDPKFTQMQDLLSRAQGVLIAPDLIKAGAIIGGKGGSAVLLGYDKSQGGWSYPAFYKMGGGSIGLQLGVTESEAVFLIMTKSGLTKLLTSTDVKLGADLSAAAGPAAAGKEADFNADMFSFAISKGLFAGASFQGTVVNPDEERNAAYYSEPVTPREIVTARIKKNQTTGSAEGLRKTLNEMMMK